MSAMLVNAFLNLADVSGQIISKEAVVNSSFVGNFFLFWLCTIDKQNEVENIEDL